ncbi:MAG: hypothetical protein WC143_00375 [Eubacteriales bacterium]
MSAAFRNFILTLLIMLGVFGYTAMKILPDIEGMIFFNNDTSDQSGESGQSGESEQPSEDPGTSGETSSEEEGKVYSFVFASKNTGGHIASLIYVEILEKAQKYITCRIPVDIYINDNGVPRKLCELLGKNDNEYLLKKISPLVGRDIDFFMVWDGDSYKAAAGIAEKSNASMSIDLPYQVKYLDPDFIEIIDPDDIPEEYYITLPPGKTPLTESNAGYIFNSSREEDMNYAFQESMGVSVFRQLFSLDFLADNIETVTSLFGSVRSNIPVAGVMKYAGLLFSYSSYGGVHITYPTVYDYNSPDMKIADWPNGIRQIKSAES